jgi:RNA polymerase sigma factor (sigma-70 family)
MDKITSQHKKWVSISETLGAGDMAEDLVQDTYLKCLSIKRKITEPFFYFLLRNTIIDYFRKSQRIFYQVDTETESIPDEIYQFINKMNWYDKMIYLSYMQDNIKIEEIARKTNKSRQAISKTIIKCNALIKNFVNGK